MPIRKAIWAGWLPRRCRVCRFTRADHRHDVPSRAWGPAGNPAVLCRVVPPSVGARPWYRDFNDQLTFAADFSDLPVSAGDGRIGIGGSNERSGFIVFSAQRGDDKGSPIGLAGPPGMSTELSHSHVTFAVARL